MRIVAIVTASLLACPVLAETVVSARTIRPNQLITEMDVTFANADLSNGYARLSGKRRA